MIVVTGGAGFIGSNIVKALNAQGRKDIIVVDDLSDGKKFSNIVDCDILDYVDKEDFLVDIISDKDFDATIEVMFHEGACSDTTEWDGRYMMKNNYEYSKILLDYCLAHKIQFIYASSAATYGMNTVFKEEKANEKPLNVYGYSKYLFDQHVRNVLPKAESQIVGLRYFNVYGPREFHKTKMSSVALQLNQQLLQNGKIKLFEGSDGYANGGQLRDFVYIDDIVNINLWFFKHPEKSGIFNAGTGRSQSFNDVANAVLAFHGRGSLEYIPFPDHLKGHYQSFTQADISALRAAGYSEAFHTVEQGVKAYLDWLSK